MKITKENLQSEFENYKQYLKDDEMRQKVQDTFDLIEFYDEDEGVRKSVDAMVELANQWIEKNKPAEPKTEPKAEPKAPKVSAKDVKNWDNIEAMAKSPAGAMKRATTAAEKAKWHCDLAKCEKAYKKAVSEDNFDDMLYILQYMHECNFHTAAGFFETQDWDGLKKHIKEVEESEKPAEKPAKTEKQPKPKFKVGDKVHCAIYDNDEDNKTIVFEVLSYNYENGEYVYYVTGDGQHYVKESKITKAKAEKPKKQPKQPKQPKQKFKVGDRVVTVKSGEPGTVESIRWVDQTTISNNKSAFVGWVYSVQFDNGVNSDERGDEIKLAPKTKAPKEPKAPEGEAVAKKSPEVTIISRFVKFGHSKKPTVEKARLILAALQKMIVNKEIRKTSQYANEIMTIQRALLTMVQKGKTDFDRAEFERYEKIANSEYQEPVAKLSRSFIGLIGKTGQKDAAKNLLARFEKADTSAYPEIAEAMIKALKQYIAGDTHVVEPQSRDLQGIFGLAGI